MNKIPQQKDIPKQKIFGFIHLVLADVELLLKLKGLLPPIVTYVPVDRYTTIRIVSIYIQFQMDYVFADVIISRFTINIYPIDWYLFL